MFMALVMFIGLVILYFEFKNKKYYQKVFDDFITATCQKQNLKAEQKLFLIEQMLKKNGYKVQMKQNSLEGRRKIFSLGLFLATLSLYILFYLYLQKPHVVKFNLNDEGTCSDSNSASTI